MLWQQSLVRHTTTTAHFNASPHLSIQAYPLHPSLDFSQNSWEQRLKGSGVDYYLQPVTVGSDSGIGIFVEKGSILRGRFPIPLADELIGIVQGVSDVSLLQINYWNELTTIT